MRKRLVIAAAISATVLGASQAKASSLELAYAEATSNTAVTATTAATAQTIVTAGAVTLDGSTKICVDVGAFGIQPPAVSTGSIRMMLWDGSTDLGRVGIATTATAASYIFPFAGRRCLTPSAGSHTYSLRSYVTSGTGNVFAGGGGADTGTPTYVRVTTPALPATSVPALSSLSDVDVTGLANGDVLAWDSASSTWKVSTPSSGSALTSDDQHRLDLMWWGVWALVGLGLVGLTLPFWKGAWGLEGKLGRG